MYNGSGGASGNSIATHETNNRFNEDGLTYSGTGDMRTTSVSSGYAGASGTWNVLLNANTENLIMDGVNLSTCTSSIVVSFGIYKSTLAENGSNLILEYSTAGAGGPWTSITWGTLPTGAGTATWYYRSSTSVIPSTANAFRWRSTDPTAGNEFRIDDLKIDCNTSACTPVSTPTVNTSAVSVTYGGTTASFSFTGGDGSDVLAVMSTDCTISSPSDGIAYTANSVFGSGDITGAGDYVVYSGPASSFSVSGLSLSTSYCVKFYEFNGTLTCTKYLTSSVASSSFTTSATSVGAYLTGIMINACDATCSEGNNEIVFGTTADYAIVANETNLDLRYGSTSPAPNTYTDNLNTNATTTANLNTFCPGTFIEGTDVTLPVGSKFMIVRNTFCPIDYDWSSLCGSGPIYVIYSSDATWITGGNFDNSGTSIRYFRLNTTTTSSTSNTVDYNYVPNDNPSSGNGAFINLDSDGGVPTSYSNNGCVVVLKVEWNYFNVDSEKNKVLIKWSTLSERNNNYFEIEMANQLGLEFISQGKTKGNGSTTDKHDYEFVLDNIEEGYYLFRIKQVDFDGNFSYSDIKSVTVTGSNFALKKITYETNLTRFTFNQDVKHGSTIKLTDITGKLIYEGIYTESNNVVEVEKHLKGLVLLTISEPFKGFSIFKIILD